jgi:hypothetical protein
VFIWKEIVCISVKRIKFVYNGKDDMVYIWNDDILRIYVKRIYCAYLRRSSYCFYLRSGYNEHFWEEYVCEVDILRLTKKRIWVFVWSEYSFYIRKSDVMCLSANVFFCVYLFFLRRRVYCVNLRRGYDVYFWKEDIVCFPVHFC